MVSEELYQRAIKVIPVGVTRSFRFFDPYPFYAQKAHGSELVDLEGKTYSDYWMGHGALVLGHLHPAIVDATREQLKLGFHFGVCQTRSGNSKDISMESLSRYTLASMGR